MKIYAETSAVLRWIFGAARGEEIRVLLGEAETVVASSLTLAEARRALTRSLALGEVEAAHLPEMHELLATAIARWSFVEVSNEILDRTAHRFPAEPVRTHDAIHLATAMLTRTQIAELSILSTDERLRRNAELLGFRVIP